MDHGVLVQEEPMDLPPGFRFHPTDEELISHYLTKKAVDAGFISRAIGDADLNKCEPWDLPSMAKMGEKEWYFFCVKDRKYPTGLRTNRATQSGYWKATGKDKEIYSNYRCKILVGMKKTLVFYRGRAPKGEKSEWVMHEFRLDGKFSSYKQRNEWVICRVFKKSPGDKKSIDISRVAWSPSEQENMHTSSVSLPPLTDVSSHVTCFSNDVETIPQRSGQNELFAEYLNQNMCYDQYQNLSLVHLLESNICPGMKQTSSRASQDTGITCDINPEISSVGSTRQEGPLSTSAQGFHAAQSFWAY